MKSKPKNNSIIATTTTITDKMIPATIANGRHIINRIVKITNDNIIIKITCAEGRVVETQSLI